MLLARWQIDARFGQKQAVIELLKTWEREIAPQIGWLAGKGRLLSGSIGTSEATVEHEWLVDDLAALARRGRRSARSRPTGNGRSRWNRWSSPARPAGRCCGFSDRRGRGRPPQTGLSRSRLQGSRDCSTLRTMTPTAFADAVAVARPWLTEDAADARPLTAVMASDALAAAFARHRALLGPDACPRGGASVWSKHLFSALLPAAMLRLLAGGKPDGNPLLAFEGHLPKSTLAAQPAGIAGPPAASVAAEWITGWLAGQVVTPLAATSGLAPRLFWSNAATMAAYLCEQWEKLPEWTASAEQLRAALFGTPPLAGQITYVATPVPEYPTVRRRRLCCIRDRVGQPLCSSCPRIDPIARDTLLRKAAATASSTRPRG